MKIDMDLFLIAIGFFIMICIVILLKREIQEIKEKQKVSKKIKEESNKCPFLEVIQKGHKADKFRCSLSGEEFDSALECPESKKCMFNQ